MTTNAPAKYSEQTFENIKHVNEYGEEYWLARELQPVLEYTQWRRFADVIERAKLACRNSGYNVEDHFADVGRTIEMPKNAHKIVPDYMLSRYACYLIVMNGDPRKEVIAVGQTIRELGGTMPEDLPTPEKSIAQIEREQDKLNLKTGGKGKK